jgi:hypothetical protein
LRSARGCSEAPALLVEESATGAVLDVSAIDAAVVELLAVSVVAGALIVAVGFGSAPRLPSRFNGAPGGVP